MTLKNKECFACINKLLIIVVFFHHPNPTDVSQSILRMDSPPHKDHSGMTGVGSHLEG